MIPEQKSLISFSLYGTDPMYSDGAIHCAESMADFYPGWTARFYVSSSIDNSILEKLKENDQEMIKKYINELITQEIPNLTS